MTTRGKMAAMMAMYGLAIAMNESESIPKRTIVNDIPRKKTRLIPKGCKVFNIDGIEVIALNEKSAKKKISKMLSSIQNNQTVNSKTNEKGKE